MSSSNVCWGIEVGAGGIKAIKLEVGSEGPKVVEFAVVPHKKVLSTPGLEQNDAMRVTLGEFISQYDLTKAAVVVSVPGHQAFARFAKLPPVEPKKVPDIVKFEAVQQIPFPIEQVEWDYQTFANADSPEVEVGIFAITRERIMEKLTQLEDVGIVPDAVTLSPVGAYNALAYDLAFTETTPGTIIMDIGTTSTDLIIAEAGRVWIRTFPIGGHHFTEALVNAFQLSYPKAEKLKREAESTKHARHVFQAMRPIFGDLAQDVQRSIGYYQSLHKDAKLERLIGVGSTFRLPGLRKFLKQQLQIDVYRLEQFKRLSLDGPRAGEFQAETLNLATAYGLALQGLGMSTLEANLMPAAVTRTALWKRKVKWFGVAAGVAAAASAVMFYRPFIDSTESNSNPVPSSVTSVISQVNSLKGEASEVTGGAQANAAVGEILGLLDHRDLHGYLLRDLSLILQDADEKAAKLPAPTSGPKPTPPAYAVKEFKPVFVGAPAEGEVPPADPSAAAGPTGPRFKIELVMTTTQPDPLRFTVNTVDAWLKANAKRADVPYQLVAADRPTTIVSTVETTESGDKALAAGAPAGGGGQVVGGSQVVGGAAPQGGGGRGGRGGKGGGFAGEGGGEAPPPMVIGRGESPQASPTLTPTAPEALDPAQQAALEVLRKIAPLPAEPRPPAGTKTTTVRVIWEAVIVPKGAAGEGGESGAAPGGGQG